jgi:outer membrane protein assembly factor BamB
MRRKHWFIVAGGVLTFLIVLILGFSWSNSSGQSTAEWWRDVADIHSFRDLVDVTTGRRAKERAMRRHQMELLSEQNLRSLQILRQRLAVQFGDSSKSPTIAPMFGGTPSRNMVNTIDKNIPTEWNTEDGKRKNIKWVAELGSYTYSSPVIADGKVFIGTNNHNPRDPKDKAKYDKDKSIGNKAVLMAFNETDGKFLWQLVHEMSDASEYREFGLVASPTVEGKRLYYITPACIVVCADTDGKIQWSFDMMKELKVYPFHCAASSPLVVGDLVMIMTGNGADAEGETLGNVRSPKAPSFIAFNKNTGKVAWQSNLPGKDIIEGQWSNPTLAVVNGQPQVIFGGGDGVLYSFEPQSGELIWKCDCNPTRKKMRKDGRSIENYITATPVVIGDRLYLGLGPMPNHDDKKKVSYFLCLDITKKGDVSLKSYDVKDAANKDSALVWAFGGPIVPPPTSVRDRSVHTGVICGTAAVHDGLVYIAENSGYLHCLDAKTGQEYWNHDFKDAIWGSPYFVDGKVYVATDTGEVVIFAPGKTRVYYADGKEQLDAKNDDKKVRAAASMDEQVCGNSVVAGGVLFIGTKTKLYAIANGK